MRLYHAPPSAEVIVPWPRTIPYPPAAFLYATPGGIATTRPQGPCADRDCHRRPGKKTHLPLSPPFHGAQRPCAFLVRNAHVAGVELWVVTGQLLWRSGHLRRAAKDRGLIAAVCMVMRRPEMRPSRRPLPPAVHTESKRP